MFQLFGVAHALQERVDTVLETVGLSMAKYMTLDFLIRAGGSMSLSSLAESRRCVRSNITQLVDRLEVDGFVERVLAPGDRRAIIARVTAVGTDRFRAGTEAIRRIEREAMAGVSDAEREDFLKVLSAFRA